MAGRRVLGSCSITGDWGPICCVSCVSSASVAVFHGPLCLPRDAEAAGGASPAARAELPPPFFLSSFLLCRPRAVAGRADEGCQRRGRQGAAAAPRTRVRSGVWGRRGRAAPSRSPSAPGGQRSGSGSGSSLPSLPAALGAGPSEPAGSSSPLGSEPPWRGCPRGRCRARRLWPQLGAPRPALRGLPRALP